MLMHASEWIAVSPEVAKLANSFEQAGFDAMDALHLASAAIGRADIFLTVDKRLYNRAQKMQHPKLIATHFPAMWLEGLAKETLP